MRTTTTTTTMNLLLQKLALLLFVHSATVWSRTYETPSSAQVDDRYYNYEQPQEEKEESSPFLIILDGGSTGSRLHIFEFVTRHQDDDKEPIVACERRGTARADQPLSAFVGATPAMLAEHLMPAFTYAQQRIPEQYHARTRVLYQATAGMRLLTEEQQEAVYDALVQGLYASTDFTFSLDRADVATLSGDLEGYYGAVAANYLHGTINAKLELVTASDDKNNINNNNQHHHAVVGALDMGGSSTQMVFLPQHKHSETDDQVCRNSNNTFNNDDNYDDEMQGNNNTNDCHVATRDEYPRALQGQDFFAQSYLSYGADQFRERLWTTWIEEWQADQALMDCDDSDNHKFCDAHVLPNPCAFPGHHTTWLGYTLVGTGEAHKCVLEVQRHIPHPELAVEESWTDGNGKRQVGGVEHPPVHGKFVAMSLYFFTLDALRALSHPDREAYEALNLSWPNPSIEELYNALDGLCSRQWQGDLEHEQHAFTRPEVLPHRCMEAVYIVTLLRDGFGFAPESRDITFTFLVDGSEVEWTLGMALAMHAESQAQTQQSYHDNKLELYYDDDFCVDKQNDEHDNKKNTSSLNKTQDRSASLVEDLRHQGVVASRTTRTTAA